VGYYNPIISTKGNLGSTASSIGQIYSITSSLLSASSFGLTGVYFNDLNPIISENVINLGFRFYNDFFDKDSISSLVMDYKTVKFKQTSPTY